MKKVTALDVANQLGISRSSVSRAFTNGANISEKMRDKIVKMAQEMGYQPNLFCT